MTRNKISANTTLFSKLINRVSILGETVYTDKRYISLKHDGEDEIENSRWLIELKIIDSLTISISYKSALIYFQDTYYFVFIGFESEHQFSDVIENEILNSGAFIALASELDINIKKEVSAFDLLQQLYNTQQNPYHGHDISDIKPLFESLSIYKVRSNCPISKNLLRRLSGYFLTVNKDKLILPFEDKTIEVYQNILLDPKGCLPYENIIQSLIEVNYKYCFLDIYRCIEKIFSYTYVDELHVKLGQQHEFEEFLLILEEATSWKPRENEAIDKLFQKLDKRDLSELLKIDDKNSDSTENIAAIASRYFYSIRNSIVHHRTSSKNIIEKDSDWQKIVFLALKICQSLYNHYATKFVDYTEFYLSGFDSANTVILTGSFNNWDSHEIKMCRKENKWYYKLDLKAGKVLYKYIIDGDWTLDTKNQLQETDENSNINSVTFIC